MTGYTLDYNPGIRDHLLSLGTAPEILEFIESLEDSKLQGRLANEIRKHPDLTLSDIEALAAKFAPAAEPRYTVAEKRALGMLDDWELASVKEQAEAGNITARIALWLLEQLRRRRIRGSRILTEHKPDYWYNLPELFPDLPHARVQALLSLREWSNLRAELYDWVVTTHAPLEDYDFADALAASDAWHRTCSLEDRDRHYEDREVIFEYDDGWTIQEVQTQNDLRTEGALMGHCVGSSPRYFEAIQADRIKILSLRDRKNLPHVTLEMQVKPQDPYNTALWSATQIQGKEDREPISEYRDRIAAWMETIPLENRPISGDEEAGDIYYSLLSDPSAVEATRLLQFVLAHGQTVSTDPYGMRVDIVLRMALVYDAIASMAAAERGHTMSDVLSGELLGRAAFALDRLNALESKQAKPVDSVQTWAARYGSLSKLEAIREKVETAFERRVERIEFTEPMPDESDFEDPDDCTAAYADWEKAEQEYMRDLRNEDPQLVYIDELFEGYFQEAKRQGVYFDGVQISVRESNRYA